MLDFRDEESTSIAVCGVVLADDWDDNDRVIGVVISTEDGDEYVVENHGLGKKLLKYVDDTVEVVGTLRRDHLGYLNLTVSDFRVVDYD